ncbi:hypothetical protein B0H11DRAFT_2259578 [Mycena galericulata]|nr:hypothetical protein B0H11DRAFT_2259578 [Mycena galericulata]
MSQPNPSSAVYPTPAGDPPETQCTCKTLNESLSDESSSDYLESSLSAWNFYADWTATNRARNPEPRKTTSCKAPKMLRLEHVNIGRDFDGHMRVLQLLGLDLTTPRCKSSVDPGYDRRLTASVVHATSNYGRAPWRGIEEDGQLSADPSTTGPFSIKRYELALQGRLWTTSRVSIAGPYAVHFGAREALGHVVYACRLPARRPADRTPPRSRPTRRCLSASPLNQKSTPDYYTARPLFPPPGPAAPPSRRPRTALHRAPLLALRLPVGSLATQPHNRMPAARPPPARRLPGSFIYRYITW